MDTMGSRRNESKDGTPKDKENQKPRARRKSLFETSERPMLSDTDRGVFVMTHADFPHRIRSHSYPLDPEKLKSKASSFDSVKVTKIINDVFRSHLADKRYSSKECGAIARELAQTIKENVAELHFPGFKLACTCIITKRLTPAPVSESGCVWDESKSSIDQDSFAEFLYRNDDLYALGTVYGVHSKKFENKLSVKSAEGNARRPSPIPE